MGRNWCKVLFCRWRRKAKTFQLAMCHKDGTWRNTACMLMYHRNLCLCKCIHNLCLCKYIHIWLNNFLDGAIIWLNDFLHGAINLAFMVDWLAYDMLVFRTDWLEQKSGSARCILYWCQYMWYLAKYPTYCSYSLNICEGFFKNFGGHGKRFILRSLYIKYVKSVINSTISNACILWG